MRLIVKNTFRDKEDHVTVYEPGTILDVNDVKRAADLVKRGLCAEYEGEADASITLGKPASKAPKGHAAKTSKKETKEPSTGASEESSEESSAAESAEDGQVSETNEGDTKEQ